MVEESNNEENYSYKKPLEEIINTIHVSLPLEISEYISRLIKDKIMPKLKSWDIPIERLGLSNRAYNSLKNAGIVKIGDIVMKSEKELKVTKDFRYGSKGLNQIKEALSKYHLGLREEYE